jgi:hypothetical protein
MLLNYYRLLYLNKDTLFFMNFFFFIFFFFFFFFFFHQHFTMMTNLQFSLISKTKTHLDHNLPKIFSSWFQNTKLVFKVETYLDTQRTDRRVIIDNPSFLGYYWFESYIAFTVSNTPGRFDGNRYRYFQMLQMEQSRTVMIVPEIIGELTKSEVY